ncbi:MAG: hypothetical protein APR63_08765 [Desulfuromonas sp. SDB]|nr:MAG: hypothetical protein APR63_08765 [Desulfuromonas sp. SDB]
MCKLFLGSTLAVLLISITTGCSSGVPQSEYDELQLKFEQAEQEIEQLNQENQQLKLNMRTAKAKADMITGLFVPAITGELDNMSESQSVQMFLEWSDKIEQSEDPELKIKFQELMNTQFSDQAMMDFFIYLFESLPEDLDYQE